MAKRNAINVLIQLLGGEEMVAELAKLGSAGEKAMKEIEGAANKVDLANLGKSFNQLGRDLGTVGKRIGVAFAGITAAAAAAAPAVISLANAGADAAEQVTKSAAAAGLQVDAFQRMAFAAEQAGTAQESFTDAMAKFNKEIVDSSEKAARSVGKLGTEIQRGAGFTRQTFDDIGVTVTRFGDSVEGASKKAAKGAKDTRTAFERLGISLRNAAGALKSPEALLLDVADAFQKLPAGAEESAIGIALFGDSFAEMLPFLNEGAEGIRRWMIEAEKVRTPFTAQQLKDAEDYNQALTDLGGTARNLRNQVGLIFTPALTQAVRAFQKVILDNRDAVLAFANGAVKTATVFVKDLLAALVGRDADVENTWILTWRDAIQQFGRDVQSVVGGVVIPAFDILRTATQAVTDAINAVFGTEFTAGEVALTASLTALVGGFGLLATAIGGVVTGVGVLVGAIGAVPVAIGAAFAVGAAAAALFGDEIVAAGNAVWNALIEGARLVWGDIVAAFESGAMTASQAFDAIVARVQQQFASLVAGVGNAFNGLKNVISSVVSAIAASIKTTIGSAIDWVASRIKDLISAARTAANAIRRAVGGGSSGGSSNPGFARGGRVFGPGTATSDSVPARLSVGEYVINAKAVDHYGPGLFAALNSMRLPFEDLFERARRFNLGGFVDGLNRSMTPRFAAGGLVGGFNEASVRPSRTVQVELKMGDTIYPMMTDNEVAAAMVRFARSQQLSRAGRLPMRR